jgi:CRP-like cAMP-binding protein
MSPEESRTELGCTEGPTIRGTSDKTLHKAPLKRFTSRPGCLPVARCMVVDASRIARFLNLADLPAEELEELAAAMNEVELEAGATVITVDDYGTAIYFIEEGTADVLDDGDETTRALGPGETFGEIGLLLTGQRTATVVARTPMRLLSLSGQDFDRIRAHVPEVEGSLRRLGIERAGG